MEFAQKLADVDDPMLVLTALRSILRDVAALRAGRAAGVAPQPRRRRPPGRPGRGAPWAPARSRLGDVTEDARTAIRQNANRLLSMDVLVDAVAG